MTHPNLADKRTDAKAGIPDGEEAIMYVQTFTVVNRDGYSFPFDMLRHEGCWPATEEDSLSLLEEVAGGKIMLQRILSRPRNPDCTKWENWGGQSWTTRLRRA